MNKEENNTGLPNCKKDAGASLGDFRHEAMFCLRVMLFAALAIILFLSTWFTHPKEILAEFARQVGSDEEDEKARATLLYYVIVLFAILGAVSTFRFLDSIF